MEVVGGYVVLLFGLWICVEFLKGLFDVVELFLRVVGWFRFLLVF